MKLSTLRAYAAVVLAGCAILPWAADVRSVWGERDLSTRCHDHHAVARLRRVHANPGAGRAALNRGTPWMSKSPIGPTGTICLLYSGSGWMPVRKTTLAPGY